MFRIMRVVRLSVPEVTLSTSRTKVVESEDDEEEDEEVEEEEGGSVVSKEGMFVEEGNVLVG